MVVHRRRLVRGPARLQPAPERRHQRRGLRPRVHAGRAGSDARGEPHARKFRALSRPAAPICRVRRDSAELGNRLQHLPLHSDVVQSQIPERSGRRLELHARPLEHRHRRQPGQAPAQCRRQLCDSGGSGRGRRASQGPRLAAPHHQRQPGVGPSGRVVHGWRAAVSSRPS